MQDQRIEIKRVEGLGEFQQKETQLPAEPTRKIKETEEV